MPSHPNDCESGQNDDCVGVPKLSVVESGVSESEPERLYIVVRGHLHEDNYA